MGALTLAGSLSAGVAATAAAWALLHRAEGGRPRPWLRTAAVRIAGAGALAWATVMASPVGAGGSAAAMASLLLCAAAAPSLLARCRRRQDAARMRRELPTLLDSLVLRTEAGMSLTAALLGSREVFPPESPTARQIGLFGRDLELGRSATESLVAMRERMQSTGAETPLGALIRGLELGTPVRGILAEQSERVRQSLLTDAERFANTLSVRLLLPLILFVFPASFLVILSPVIVFLLEGGPW